MTFLPSLTSPEIRWLAVCAAFALGEYGALAGAAFAPLWPLAAGAAVLTALVGYGASLRGWGLAFAALAGCALALCAAERRRAVLDEAFEWGAGRPFRAVFTLREDARPVPSPANGGARRVEFWGETRGVRMKVVADLPSEAPMPLAGETWEAAGWAVRGVRHDLLAAPKLWVTAGDTSIKRTSPARDGFAAWLRRARADIARRLALGGVHGEETVGLARAMLLGERTALAGRTRQAFNAAGALHVFAVSGLHVMVIARTLVLLGLCLFLPLRFCAFLTVPVLWLYVLMIGAAPSAVRAAVMASVSAFAPLFFRRPSGVVAWSVAFLSTHALNPTWIAQVGSALSFAVMLALVLLARLASRRARGVCVTVTAWAAGVPILAHVFGSFTPGGLVSGLLVVPAATVVVAVETVAVLASFVSDAVAAYANAFAGLVLRLMTLMADAVAGLPGAMVRVRPWGLGECLAWYAVIPALVWLVRRVTRRHSLTV